MKIKNSLFILILLVGSLTLVFANSIVTLNSPNSVNQSVSVLYNISVNNTDLGALANISTVNITLPSNFTFVNASNGTDALGIFTNYNNVLSWTNNSFLINGSSINRFWFNANASSPGVYNLTIETYNYSGIVNSTNISITVNNTSAPVIVPANPSNYSNISGSNYRLNVNVNDYSPISAVIFNITNSTLAWNLLINNATNTSLSSWNSTLNTNSLVDGGYYNITVIANDSLGYKSNITLFNVRVDNTAPSTPNIQNNGTSQNELDIDVTDTDTGSGISYCVLKRDGSHSVNLNSQNSTHWTATDTNLNCGTSYDYNITCYDYAGNSNSNSDSYSTDNCQTNPSSGSGSGSSGSWDNTYSYTDQEFSFKGSINKNLSENERISIELDGNTYYIGVVSINSNNVVLNVSSLSQEKTIYSGQDNKFDLNADNYYDVNVQINNIYSSEVNLTLTYLHQVIASAPSSTGNSNSNSANLTTNSASTTTQYSSFGWIIIVVIVSIVILIGIVIIWFATNNGGNPFKFRKDKYLQL